MASSRIHALLKLNHVRLSKDNSRIIIKELWEKNRSIRGDVKINENLNWKSALGRHFLNANRSFSMKPIMLPQNFYQKYPRP